MRHDLDILRQLADNRQRRMQPDGRPAFALTDEEVAGSTRTAMRLALASKSQVGAQHRLSQPA